MSNSDGSDPLLSAELRWFDAGEIPPSVWSWFKLGLRGPTGSSDGIDPEPERTDRYLLLPGVDSVSIKLRGNGGFQVKRREGAYAAFSMAGLIGRLGVWKKWELPAADDATGALVYDRSGDWVDVGKRRSQRKYGVFGVDVRAMADPRNDRPDNGCNVELSRLERGPDDVWWTVCFEAFGNDPAATLERVLSFAVIDAPAPVLEAGRMEDYPGWLGAEPTG